LEWENCYPSNNMIKDVYQELKPAVVAIALSRPVDKDFFTIIGTGFFLREDGIVLTNKHVLDAINNLPQVKAGSDPFKEACVLMFIEREVDGKRFMSVLPLLIDKFWLVNHTLPPEVIFYGNQPDIGLIVLKDVRGCPTLKVYKGEYREGEAIAASGFPLGTSTLKSVGHIHQLTPTLKLGTIGAVLPFTCESPHSLLLDMMVQHGSSGSPVFLQDTGEVIGIVNSGMVENGHGTNLTYCIPSWYFKELLDKMEDKAELNELRKRKTPLKEWIASRNPHRQVPKTPISGVGWLQ